LPALLETPCEAATPAFATVSSLSTASWFMPSARATARPPDSQDRGNTPALAGCESTPRRRLRAGGVSVSIFYLSVRPVRRGAGGRATGVAAYCAGARIFDERLGLTCNHSRRLDVEHTEIVLPSAAGSDANGHWALNRERLWNAAEHAERRKDARVAREYQVALPHELNAAQRQALAIAFARQLADRYGCAVDTAIHAPHPQGDPRNHHAHLLATTRTVTSAGLGAKTDIELNGTGRAKKGLGPWRGEITAVRQRWAGLVNEHLAQHGHTARVDHRSLAAQGIDREPTVHLGPAVTAIERRGGRSYVMERIREQMTARLALAHDRPREERESREFARDITEPTAASTATDAEHGARQTRSLDDIRREGREQWLANRMRQQHAKEESSESTEDSPARRNRAKDNDFAL